jgi:hypothetical protein
MYDISSLRVNAGKILPFIPFKTAFVITWLARHWMAKVQAKA